MARAVITRQQGLFMEFTGAFETHLTVQLEADERVGALREWGARHGFTCLHIVLDRGRSSSQPMLTRRARGRLSEALTAARGVCEALRAEGYPVTRIKLEAAPTNEDVPATSAEAREIPGDRYFEHHVKLLLEPDVDGAALATLAERHAAHLSRNALRTREDGRLERFVTQRCGAMGRAEAGARLEALLRDLELLGLPVIGVEQEFVVYDDNPAIDAGWGLV